MFQRREMGGEKGLSAKRQGRKMPVRDAPCCKYRRESRSMNLDALVVATIFLKAVSVFTARKSDDGGGE
jgi:hypothetical protein